MLTQVWRLVGPLEHRRLPGAGAGARLLHGVERSSGAWESVSRGLYGPLKLFKGHFEAMLRSLASGFTTLLPPRGL